MKNFLMKDCLDKICGGDMHIDSGYARVRGPPHHFADDLIGNIDLSSTYKNIYDLLEFQCQNNHTWKTQAQNILNGSWCHVCNKIPDRVTKEEILEIAKQRGGTVDVADFKNVSSKLKWTCKNHHSWISSVRCVKNSQTWCIECNRLEQAQIQIYRVQQYAKERGGSVDSTSYKNNTTKLQWTCDQGHQWLSNSDYVVGRKRWCPTCAYNKQRKKNQ